MSSAGIGARGRSSRYSCSKISIRTVDTLNFRLTHFVTCGKHRPLHRRSNCNGHGNYFGGAAGTGAVLAGSATGAGGEDGCAGDVDSTPGTAGSGFNGSSVATAVTGISTAPPRSDTMS